MAKVGFNNGVFTALQFTVDPQAAADGAVQYSESGVAKWRHGNDETDDSWRLSQGSALGTTDALIATANRNILKPAQTAFQAYNNAPIAATTGDGTNFTITFNAVDYNVGSGFVDPNFIATEAGIYLFTATIVLTGLLAGHTSGQLYMQTSTGQTQYGVRMNPFAMSDGGVLAIEANGQFRLAAAEQVFLVLQVSGGAKVVAVYGAALTAQPSSFQGVLLG